MNVKELVELLVKHLEQEQANEYIILGTPGKKGEVRVKVDFTWPKEVIEERIRMAVDAQRYMNEQVKEAFKDAP